MGFKLSKKQLRKKAEMEALKESDEIGKVFTCFPKLPPELRIRVWKEVASTLRIVKLRLNKDVGLRGKGWSSSTRVPALLHVNCEARQEGLKSYSLFFPLEQNRLIISPPRVYFNPLVDTLYLNMNSMETSRGPWVPDKTSLAEVQHIAVQTCVWTYAADHGYRYGNDDHLNLDALSKYKDLKTLTLVRDFTTLSERRREKCMRPVAMRQCLTNERKILQKIQEKFVEMANKDSDNLQKVRERWIGDIAQKSIPANTPEPMMEHTTTPAVRVLEYEDVGVVCKNGAKEYDSEGKWVGYERGKFIRLGRGWEWIVPKQWEDEEGRISEDRKLALQRVDGWR